jgi:hypothetical protein
MQGFDIARFDAAGPQAAGDTPGPVEQLAESQRRVALNQRRPIGVCARRAYQDSVDTHSRVGQTLWQVLRPSSRRHFMFQPFGCAF